MFESMYFLKICPFVETNRSSLTPAKLFGNPIPEFGTNEDRSEVVQVGAKHLWRRSKVGAT
jgi:hypothetical protein